MDDYRKEFLIQMYNQMLNDINRHILVVWQSVSTLIGAFAILALVEKKIVSLDIAVALMVLITAWLAGHLIDASFWYNRNLVIIANIERQFLRREDLREIHFYFGSHRPNNMITHLRLQLYLGVGLISIVLLYHASERIVPGFSSPLSSIEPLRGLPYFVFALSMVLLFRETKIRDKKYAHFVKTSPGIHVDTSDIELGPGHGHS